MYMGPTRWWHEHGDDYVSREWCAGQVRGATRSPEYPIPTLYSREVKRRIIEARVPPQPVAKILGWPK